MDREVDKVHFNFAYSIENQFRFFIGTDLDLNLIQKQIDMKLLPLRQTSFQLMMIVAEKRNYCYWCGQKLKNCDACRGKGETKEHTCHECKGQGMTCPTHDTDWD